MAKLPTVEIHGNPYVLVKDRLLAFHETHKFGSITTEITINGDSVLAKATVQTNDVPNQTCTGHSEAVRGKSNGITGQSPVEVAETSAVGRALGMLGIGILESVASADEIRKAPKAEPVVADPNAPSCEHGAMKKVQVRKEGKNKGRYFYACPEPQGKQCEQFIWADELAPLVDQEEAPMVGADIPY